MYMLAQSSANRRKIDCILNHCQLYRHNQCLEREAAIVVHFRVFFVLFVCFQWTKEGLHISVIAGTDRQYTSGYCMFRKLFVVQERAVQF